MKKEVKASEPKKKPLKKVEVKKYKPKFKEK